MVPMRKKDMMPDREANKQRISGAVFGGEQVPTNRAAQPAIPTQDIIANLRAKLLSLNDHITDGSRLFRLSFSIMTLETCLKERGLAEIRLNHAPGIQALIGRIETEIQTLRDQSAAPRAVLNGDIPAVIKQNIIGLVTPKVEVEDASKTLPDQITSLSRQLDDLRETLTQPDSATALQSGLERIQKSLAADVRRNFASLAALHASIERLSARIERFESRLAREDEPQSVSAPTITPASIAVREKELIDPRPMLAAARAAVARASMGIEPRSQDPSRDLSQVNQPSSGSFPELPSKPHRRKRWGFAFAAA